jgi:hypothetical protein
MRQTLHGPSLSLRARGPGGPCGPCWLNADASTVVGIADGCSPVEEVTRYFAQTAAKQLITGGPN